MYSFLRHNRVSYNSCQINCNTNEVIRQQEVWDNQFIVFILHHIINLIQESTYYHQLLIGHSDYPHEQRFGHHKELSFHVLCNHPLKGKAKLDTLEMDKKLIRYL